MRLPHIVPYALIVLLAVAALDAVPGVVAEREGGMGLGSALIAAQLAQVAGIGLGATLGVHVIGRWSLRVGLVLGALLLYGGLIGVGHQPAHLLGWVVGILFVAGTGLGMLLTASFVAAAAVDRAGRPFAVALLLLASLVAGQYVGTGGLLAGIPVLVAVAALVVAIAVLVGRVGAVAHGYDTGPEPDRLPMGRAFAGGSLIAVGILATLFGIDPSRVSVGLVAGVVGAGLPDIEALSAGLVVIGLLLVAGGAIVLGTRRRLEGATFVAALGVGLMAFAAAGVPTFIAFAIPTADSPLGGGFDGIAALGAGMAGLLIGSWLLAAGRSPRGVAVGGGLALAVVSLVATIGEGSVLRAWSGGGPLAGIVLAACGAGLAATTLRLLLADARPGRREFAAAAGVMAATFGARAGSMVGAGEGLSQSFGLDTAFPIGSLVLVAAGVAGIAVAAMLPGIRPDGAPASKI